MMKSRPLYISCYRKLIRVQPADAERIAKSQHLTADQFATEVLIAEGMRPGYEKQWRKRYEIALLLFLAKRYELSSHLVALKLMQPNMLAMTMGSSRQSDLRFSPAVTPSPRELRLNS